MALLVLRGVDDLSTANSDNVQWSLAQADVEFLRFRIALRDAEEDPTALESVRRRFDVFYSRMATIESGEMYRAMRDDPQFRGPRTRVRDFLSESVPFIDSPDADLRASLPLLA
ncbi:MAG TPA: hybrid sensor histidine kinase/response regulator, partial [Citreicella sp.]|nr:hybrid sensor histidine kinase/response regulator [Citreicella sp.]